MYKSFKSVATLATLQQQWKKEATSGKHSSRKTEAKKKKKEQQQPDEPHSRQSTAEELKREDGDGKIDALDEEVASDNEEEEEEEEDDAEEEDSSGSESSSSSGDDTEEESSGSDSEQEEPPLRKNKQDIDLETWAKKIKNFKEIEDFLRGATSSLSIVFFGPEKVLDSFQRLFFLYKYQSHCRSKMGDVLASQEYGGEILNILRIALNTDTAAASDVMSIIWLGMLILLNYSDSSEKFATNLAEAGAIEFLTTILDPEHFKDSMSAELKRILEQNSLGILHNMAKVGGMKTKFNKAQTVQVIHPYVKSSDEETSAIALLILAYIVEDEDKTTLIDDMNVIGNCIEWLNLALQDDKGKHRGFSAWELAQGLAKLAANDSNKTKITEKDALKPLLKLLQRNDPKEQSASAKCLLNLSFNKDAAEKIRECPDLIKALEKQRNNEHKRVKKYVQRALLMIKGSDAPEASCGDSDSNAQYDVFISYSWKDKEITRKVFSDLAAAGYKVWIDIERMEGSTLQAMAEAVEKSNIVLICVSEAYKESLNCRTEAEYTFSKGKEFIPLMMQPKYKPDGWLGAMNGAKLFFDFSGKYSYEETYQNLLKELQRKLTSESRVSSASATERAIPDAAVDTAPKTPKEICMAMTRKDVRSLLKSKGLKELPPELSKMDGEFFWQLRELRGNDRQNFYKIMNKEYDMNLMDVTKLNAAMDSLDL